MSYILDALQRAEAERERGHVPGLKSQLLPPAGRHQATPSAIRPWHAAVGLAAVLVALTAWWWTADSAPEDPASTSTRAPELPPAGTPLADPPAMPAGVAAPAPVSPTGQAAMPVEPTLPILAPPRAPPATPRTAPSTNAPSEKTAAASPAPPSQGAAPKVATPAPAAARTEVPAFGELTADARAQLPAVNVSGATYSQNPALRMLIVNGKVVQEGQDIVPGLRLETIGPRNAVLNHQGLRYSIGY